MKLLLGLVSPSLFAYITGEIEIKDKDCSSVQSNPGAILLHQWLYR